ncbi:MAG TPA: hypothetical protein VER96_00610 [Polyangiaceae bacterium]|nr:hypothetical protein [Polyangiaceae bacterium]
MAWRGLWLGSLLFGAGFVACVTNHEALEKKPAGRATGGGGGTLASGGAPSHRGGSGEQPATGGGHADDEPPGDSVLTIVNGIVDAPSVALCLARVDSDGTVTPLGSPLTDAPLEYGQSLVLHEVDGVDFDVDGLEPIAIAGELDRIAGLDCEAAIARARSEEALGGAGSEPAQGGAAGDGAGMGMPPSDGNGGSSVGGSSAEAGGSGGASPGPKAVRSALRVRGLPAISPGTLNAGRSLVFAANGCMGGATYSGKDAEAYCGAGYTPLEPTLSAVLVSLSRQVSDDHVALQAVHASLANAQVDLRSRPPFPSLESGVAITSVSLGQVAPRPASIQNALSDLGSARKYRLSVESKAVVLFYQPWSAVLSNGGLSQLQNGQGYALIFSGPRADLPAVTDLWNAPTLTAIAVDPE